MTDFTSHKQKLEADLATITEELKTLGINDPSTDDWIATPEEAQTSEPDPNDEADTVEDWNERRAILSQLETRYNNLKRALEKIENGTYGVCEIGGKPIEEDRLTANPAARTCKTHMNEEGSLPVR